MKFRIYKDAEGWHWTLLAVSGREVARSPEVYDTLTKAEHGADGMVTRIAAEMVRTEPGEPFRIPKEKVPVAPEHKAKKR